jgi:uncharacterized RDD family membrane protein YckC
MPPPGPEDQVPGTPAYSGKGSGPRAGFWQRFAALFVDWLVLLVPNVILILLLSDAIAQVLGVIIGIAYFAYFEGGPTGQTIGKRTLGIRVIDLKVGGPIGYGRGVLRYIGRILSTIVVLLGYFWMLWDSESQTWHDKIAGTVVVPVDAYPVS